MDTQQRYLKEVDRILASEAPFGARKVRELYLYSGFYDRYGSDPNGIDLSHLEFDAERAAFDALRRQNFAIMTVHHEFANRYGRDESVAEVDTSLYAMHGMRRQITAQFGGTSKQDAYPVLCVSEEYFLLSYKDYKLLSQDLREVDGHHYDVLEVCGEDESRTREVWFDVSPLFGQPWLNEKYGFGSS